MILKKEAIPLRVTWGDRDFSRLSLTSFGHGSFGSATWKELSLVLDSMIRSSKADLGALSA